MKKPLKVLSSTALAAALMSSSLVPAAVMAAEDQQEVNLDAVVLENDGKFYTAELESYVEASTEQFSMSEKFVQVGEKYFTVEDFIEAQVEAGNLDDTAKLLQDSYKPVSVNIDGKLIAEDGKWIYQDEQPEDRLNETFFYNVA